MLALPKWHHGGDAFTAPDGRVHRVDVVPRVVTNNQVAIREMTRLGMGLSFHVEPEVEEDLNTGRLVRVLADWNLPHIPVMALMPSRTRQSTKVRLAVDALSEHLDAGAPNVPAHAKRGRTHR